MQHIDSYDDFRSGKRSNFKPQGFDFDMDTFENLIDRFVPQDDILTILQVDRHALDKFCSICYNGKNFDTTYRWLSAISKSLRFSTIDALAMNGHSYALSLEAKHFLGLDDKSESTALTITFKNDLE